MYQNVLEDTLRVSWRRVGKEIAMFIEWNLFIVQHLSLICRKSSFAASFHCFAGLRASAPSFSTTFVIVGVFSARPNPRLLSTQFYEWTRTPPTQLKIMRLFNIPSRCWLNITCDGSRWCLSTARNFVYWEIVAHSHLCDVEWNMRQFRRNENEFDSNFPHTSTFSFIWAPFSFSSVLHLASSLIFRRILNENEKMYSEHRIIS